MHNLGTNAPPYQQRSKLLSCCSFSMEDVVSRFFKNSFHLTMEQFFHFVSVLNNFSFVLWAQSFLQSLSLLMILWNTDDIYSHHNLKTCWRASKTWGLQEPRLGTTDLIYCEMLVQLVLTPPVLQIYVAQLSSSYVTDIF